METKRNIKQENEIINNIVDIVKKFYLWRFDNYGNHEKFYKNVYNRIVQSTYDYFDEDNQKDPVMGRFCKYMVETFSNGRPWFEENEIKRMVSVENKLLIAIHKPDYERYAFEHIDEVERKIGQMHIIELYEKKLGIKD